MHKLFSILVFLFLAKTATTQVVAKATVDSTHMLIGDQMRLHLEVGHPADVIIQPLNPAVADSTIEFLGQSKWDTLQKNGSTLRLQKDLVFTAWDSGYLQVPPIPVVYLQGSRQDTVYTRNIPIEVIMPKVDTTLADIKPIIEEPAKWQDYLPYLLGITAMLAVVVVVIALRKRKTKKSLPSLPPVVLLPHEIALQKLAELKKQKRWQQGLVKEYHSELTYILREYLENRYGIQALEQTTDEILTQLKKPDLSTSLSEKLEHLLQTADLVKFAKAQPPLDFHDRAMAYVEDFILETKPLSTISATTEIKDVQ
jgi:hypothetical protein